MKAIKIKCKTAGFKYGDTAEVGTGKSQISLEDAQALVASGFAEEMEVVMSSDKSENSPKVIELEAKVKELTEANTGLAGEKVELEAKVKELAEAGDEALLAEIEKLKGFVDEAINSSKGTIPAGYKGA